VHIQHVKKTHTTELAILLILINLALSRHLGKHYIFWKSRDSLIDLVNMLLKARIHRFLKNYPAFMAQVLILIKKQ